MSHEASDIEKLRHSLAHLLAAAVQELYPDAKRAIGPAIEHGFYYDFEFKQSISDADLPNIEDKMREILPQWQNFTRHEVTKEQALQEFGENQYKKELIEEFTSNNQTLTIYQSGDFRDLCKGGHTDEFFRIDAQAFHLTHLAGAYWRGNEGNPMLTRIYGLAFGTKEELQNYLTMLKEAEKRDHRKLGQQLDLVTFSELVGAGLPLWTPKGTIVRELLDEYVNELRANKGYERVDIPHITKKELYEKSGHWEKFKSELFTIKTREGHEFAMKPMNCPHHTQIFKRKLWSYRDMPQRYANTTMCYRDEQTGELNGLSRVRSFTQDDAHVFCREDQVQQEMSGVWEIVEIFYKHFGFDLRVRLSFWDEQNQDKYLGEPGIWHKAQERIEKLAEAKNINFIIAHGEAAFYGPKIDFLAKDSLGREWQVATIQLDMNLPERFDLYCINEQGTEERIVMIHAAIMGSIERFLSILIEHTAGAFPVWLAPEQAVVLPVSEKQNNHATEVVNHLLKHKVRIRADNRNESLGKRIRDAELQKIPYIVIVGEKEVLDNSVSVRYYHNEDKGVQSLAQFTTNLVAEIANKR